MKTIAIISTRYLVLTVVLILMLPIGQSLAADITVDAGCSLANAIRSANGEELVEPRIDCETGNSVDEENEAQTEGTTRPGLDIITIDITGADEGAIALDATLAVSSDIVIEGGGFSVNGGGNQIFSVTLGSLVLNDLTMINGFSLENGGAISVTNGALTLRNSAVRNSGARGLGGGIYALDSDVTLLGSVISGNATGAAAEDYPPAEIVEDDNDGQAESGDQELESQTEDTDTVEPSATPEAEEPEAEEPEAEEPEAEEPEAEEESDEETGQPEVAGTHGGGLYFAGENSSLIMGRSGVDSNSAPTDGGGIYIASGEAEISNSTMSGNNAMADGGGIYNAGTSVFKHLTVVGNSGLNSGGIVDAGTLQLYNSILSENAGGDCFGSLNGNLGNIIRDNSCNHDGATADPNLLPLAGSPAYYVPQEGSPAIDAAWADYCAQVDQRGIERLAESCDIGAAEYEAGAFNFQIQSALAALSPDAGGASSGEDEGGSSSEVEGSGEEEGEDEEEEVSAEPTLAPSNCGDLPGHIVVTGATPSLSCEMLDWSGLVMSSQLLVDSGALQAVDIFGWLGAPVTICFEGGSGVIVLLDAASSPPDIAPLQTYPEGNWQCATVERPGTAVLMPLEFATSGAISDPIWDISGCTVTTTDILNLREGPSINSSIRANVLNDVSLTADQRNSSFYRVNYFGIVGWLSKDYLRLTGSCH